MKTLCVALAAFGLFAGSAAFAQEKKEQTPEQRFARLDKNSDKKLSVEEFVGKKTDEAATKAKAAFTKADADKDMSLSLEEFKTIGGKKKAE